MGDSLQDNARNRLLEITRQLFRKLHIHPIFRVFRQELTKLYPTPTEELLTQLELASIAVSDFNLQEPSVAAVLLLPAYMDGRISSERITVIAPKDTDFIVHRLALLTQIEAEAQQADPVHLREMIVSSARDIRALLLMLADRLYWMRVAKERLDENARRTLAARVRDIYVPIAHKLGLYAVKGEMEDLVLKYIDPERFYFIKEALGKKKHQRDAYMERVVATLTDFFNKMPVRWHYTIKARTKSISSIHNKMIKKGTPFEQIYDLSALRIIIDAPEKEEHEACWYFYSMVTELFEPDVKRLRDWISNPKKNGYRSLQITVLALDGQYVEVQIRTTLMDEVAEHGVAAHWRYKGLSGQSALDSLLEEMRGAIEENPSQEDAAHTLSLAPARSIYVFTPKGELKRLPGHATLLDFAFAIHSKVGAKAIGGRINGKNASLKEELHSGDRVEILTSRNQFPKEDWLQIVVSDSAKQKIRRLIREEREGTFADIRETIDRRLKNRRLPYDEKLFIKTFQSFGYESYDLFYTALSTEKCDLNHFLDRYDEALKENEAHEQKLREERIAEESRSIGIRHRAGSEEGGVIIGKNLIGINYELAKCCRPQYGDAVFAYPGRSGMRIHRYDCPNAPDILKHYRDRVLPARWEGLEDRRHGNLYVVALENAETTARILSLAKNTDGVELLSYNFRASNGILECELTLGASAAQLNTLRKKLLSVDGVRSVDAP